MRRTRCFLPAVGSPPNAPRLTKRATRPCSSSHTYGSRSQNLGGMPPAAAKWYRGFVLRMTSLSGAAPRADSSRSGRGAAENWVMESGHTFVRRMSMSWEDAADACIEARDV